MAGGSFYKYLIINGRLIGPSNLCFLPGFGDGMNAKGILPNLLREIRIGKKLQIQKSTIDILGRNGVGRKVNEKTDGIISSALPLPTFWVAAISLLALNT